MKDTKAEDHRRFMLEAFKEARKAELKGEVPIGAVMVKDGKVLSRGYNKKELSHDPASHAELVAIRKASSRVKSWRLSGAVLYVTLEPCLMCMGAVIQARIPKLVFAAFDPKAGACGSLYDISKDGRLNHRVEVQAGVMEEEACAMLKKFFSDLRRRNKTNKSV